MDLRTIATRTITKVGADVVSITYALNLKDGTVVPLPESTEVITRDRLPELRTRIASSRAEYDADIHEAIRLQKIVEIDKESELLDAAESVLNRVASVEVLNRVASVE